MTDTLEAAVGRYEAALHACAADPDGEPADIGVARGELLTAVGRLLRASAPGTLLVEGLRRALLAVDDARSALGAEAAAFEEGAIDAVLALVRSDDVAALPEPVRALTRNAHHLRILRVLRDVGELSNQRLAAAARLRPRDGAATDSEQQMTSRRVTELRKHDLVFTVVAGRERLVRLTPTGEDLLDHVDRGHVPEADPGMEIAEIPEVRLRPMLRDAALAPRVHWPADDRSRFYLYVGGLYVADELLASERWSPSERVLANLLWQHPLSDWPYASDMDVYQRVVARWAEAGSADTTSRDLMHCLFRHQRDDAREALAAELFALGGRVKGPLTLLWAPAAVNAAAWARSNDSDLHEPLLRCVEDTLASFTDVPLALHLRAFSRAISGDREGAEALWARLRAGGPERPVGRLADVIRRANTQIVACAALNPAILRVEAEASHAVLDAARAANAPFDVDHPRVREPGWLDAFLAWLEQDADRVEDAFARQPRLPEACEALVGVANAVTGRVDFERAHFEASLDYYMRNASWLLDLADGRVAPGRQEDSPTEPIRRARNQADGEGHIAAAHCRERRRVAAA
jgi:DNA-binding transcriptional ArsR family regulator